MAARPWLASLTALIALMVVATLGVLAPSPHVAAGEDSAGQLLRAGFAMAETRRASAASRGSSGTKRPSSCRAARRTPQTLC